MFKHTHDSSVTLLCPKITSCSKINFIIFFHPSIMLDHLLAKVLPLYSHFFSKVEYNSVADLFMFY